MGDTKQDAVKVLTDDEVADVLKRARLTNATWHSGGYVDELLKMDIPALCATVRVLRAELYKWEDNHDRLCLQREQLYRDVYAENTALREQLAQVEAALSKADEIVRQAIDAKNDAATRMRDVCVAKVKERADSRSCNWMGNRWIEAEELIAALESLTLDQVEQEK